MEELKLEPDTERHSSYGTIRRPGTPELFTFTEVKVNCCLAATAQENF
jgi:hypothetical protein